MKAGRGPIVAVTLIFALCSGPSAPHAQDVDVGPSTLTVAGEGTQVIVPDLALVTVGVVFMDPSAAAALRSTGEVMQRTLEALRRHGVEGSDVQTGRLTLRPRQSTSANQVDSRGKGTNDFVAVNEVAIRVRDLRRVGPLLDELVALGSNEVRGVRFDVADRERPLDVSRLRAVQDAQRKATLYAQAAGVQLGEVVSLQEEPTVPSAREYSLGNPSFEASAVPVEAGEISIRSRVRMVWRLVRERRP